MLGWCVEGGDTIRARRESVRRIPSILQRRGSVFDYHTFADARKTLNQFRQGVAEVMV